MRACKIISYTAPLIFLMSGVTVYAAAEGVPVQAEEIWYLNGFPITNSMITSWVISLGIIITVKTLVRKPALLPPRGQIIVESVVGGLRGN